MQRLVPAVLRASRPAWTRTTVTVVCTRLVFRVTMHLAPCSLPWLAGPECSAFWPVWTRRAVARGVQAMGFSGRWLLWVSVFSAQLGSIVDTCTASVYEAFLEEVHRFPT